ncbi:Nucleus export protein brr6 [Neolecta irregularis DAH-3]|uniref:Nucleus export protein brr6 n=1 Tax=Neolecta irregularis (strain DAH-3) TaxID=1198029 RepID=A0A1U7LSI3_NEOID|nr:Nucleus export protein brr6 [Neolecta irregularis DAH-3]|eukprot:OLL25636.1 Nucleus export protein brr6 [Neolecta irregularis DAH-3]
MNTRTKESPMDFTYDNRESQFTNNSATGSPFVMNTLQSSLLGTSNEAPRKRPHFETGSPQKPETQQSNIFGPPSNTPFLFSTPKTIPSTRHHRWNERPQNNGVENTPGSSPEKSDKETTPLNEVKSLAIISNIDANKKKVSDRVRKRVDKRRRQEDFWTADSEEDERSSPIKRPEFENQQKSWTVETHRDIPYIASGYLQLLFNLFLIGILLYLVLAFVKTIQRDVDQKVEEYSAEILQEIKLCEKEYLENRCTPGIRVPAMEAPCEIWSRCMNRDPTIVGRARVSAETFAEIVNSFIEPISYKTMIFAVMLIFGSLFLSNFAFGLFRAKSNQGHTHPYITTASLPPIIQPHWDPHFRSPYASSRGRTIAWN